jgi:hypothetical protein
VSWSGFQVKRSEAKLCRFLYVVWRHIKRSSKL